MGALRWYKRDPRAALAGMMELTLEERGAYNSILDLIYIHDGAIDDNDHVIAAWLNVRPRTWRRIRAVLLQRGKLYPHAGTLRNERADQEVRNASERLVQTQLAGRLSAVARGHTPKNVNDLASTLVQRPFELPTSRKKESLLPYFGADPKSSDLSLPHETHGSPPRQNGHASPTLAAVIKAKGWTP